MADAKLLEALRLLADNPGLLEAALKLAGQAPAEPVVTFRQLWEGHYSKWAERHQKTSWEASRRGHGIHLLAHFGDMPWNKITHDDIDAYCDKRLKEKGLQSKRPIEPATVNLEVASAKRCVSHCLNGPTKVIRGSNPFERYPELTVVSKRRFSISDDDFVKLLEHSRPLLRLLLVFAGETGMRRDEFRCLEWTEVDMAQALVKLPPERTKTRRARDVPLSDVAMAVLRTVPRLARSVYVFENPKGNNKPVPETTLDSWFRKACELAGIKGPKGQPVWMHTLRKKFGTDKAMGGMPIYQLMEVMGHNDPNVHYEYTKMSPEHHSVVRAHLNKRMGPQAAPKPEAEKAAPRSPLLAYVRSE